jgi:hypothetical protein
MAVALLALLIAAGGVAVAAIPNANGTINGCYNPKNGALRVIDSGQSCSKGETALTLASADATGKVANADKLDGLDSADFAPAGGPECPSGTQAFGGGCIETGVQQTLASFANASSTCASLSRRLPTGAELEAFRQQAGINLGGHGSPYEWTGDIIRHHHTLEEDGYEPETLVMDDAGTYHRGSHHPTVTLAFRCVQ